MYLTWQVCFNLAYKFTYFISWGLGNHFFILNHVSKASNVPINILGAGITVVSMKRQGPMIHYNLLGEPYINQLYMKNKVTLKMW